MKRSHRAGRSSTDQRRERIKTGPSFPLTATSSHPAHQPRSGGALASFIAMAFFFALLVVVAEFGVIGAFALIAFLLLVGMAVRRHRN